MVPALVGLLIGGGALLVVLFVSALLLRAAAATANRIVGPPEEGDFEFGDWGDWDSDEPPRRRREEKSAIPEPGVGKGMVAAFAAAFATATTGGVLAVIAEEVFGVVGDGVANAVVLSIFATPVGLAALTFLLVGLLPTTFGRAALVAFLYYLYSFAIATAVICTIWGCFALADR